jgi:putative addiction module component (TIGR02574 family)
MEERISLLEYLEQVISLEDSPLSEEQRAMLDRRDAEMDADPSIGLTKEEFFERLRDNLSHE